MGRTKKQYEPYLNPKNNPLGSQKAKTTKNRQKLNVQIEDKKRF